MTKTSTHELPEVLAAVTAADPYPFYAGLRASRPFGFDPQLGAFIAADAASVRAVLAEPRWRVRPPAEPVPAALVGSAAGEIFRHLVRMDDSAEHESRKAAVGAAIAATLVPAIAGESRRQARRLLEEGGGVGALAFRLPVQTLAALLGVPPAELAGTAEKVGALVRCLAPGGSAGEVAAGKEAAAELLELFGGLNDPSPAGRANTIGLLTQAYEATAGLIANTLLALARRPALREQAIADPERIRPVVREVARFDPPVQNTRRFASESFVFRGQPVREGELALVLLAAACRDPALYPDADRFDPDRPAAHAPVWGHGRHQCPGGGLATEIAAAAIAALAERGALPAEESPFAYRPSLNTRIPNFGGEAARSPR